MSDLSKIRKEVAKNGVAPLQDEEDVRIWLTVFTKAIANPTVSGRDGSWIRGFATNCANYAVLALRDGEE